MNLLSYFGIPFRKLNINSLFLFISLLKQPYFITISGGCFSLTTEKLHTWKYKIKKALSIFKNIPPVSPITPISFLLTQEPATLTDLGFLSIAFCNFPTLSRFDAYE